MIKTFKSMYEDSDIKIQVRQNHNGTGVHIAILMANGLQVSKSDAPAIALAILEAAGITDKGFAESSDAEMAVAHLSSHVGLERANAKVAADREALELEALELYNKVMRSGKDPLSEWLPTLQFTRIKYTNIATAAREIHGATK